MEDSKSTLGYVFMMSGGVVAWSSHKQPIVTLSTTEAEFVASSACACQAVWMRRILKERHSQIEEKKLMCGNTSTIKLSKNSVLHRRCKHIRVRFHFFKDLTKEGTVDLLFILQKKEQLIYYLCYVKSFCSFLDKASKIRII